MRDAKQLKIELSFFPANSHHKNQQHIFWKIVDLPRILILLSVLNSNNLRTIDLFLPATAITTCRICICWRRRGEPGRIILKFSTSQRYLFGHLFSLQPIDNFGTNGFTTWGKLLWVLDKRRKVATPAAGKIYLIENVGNSDTQLPSLLLFCCCCCQSFCNHTYICSSRHTLSIPACEEKLSGVGP